jgi:predicted NUDIX family phosphoesterase
MTKSPRQLRAESAAQRYRASARSPFVIEFAGVPKAGKTSTLNQVQAFLKRCGFATSVVVERASVCPIRDKKHANFNIWTACTTLAQILEKTQVPPRSEDPDILILDRGLFDSIWWLELMERLARIRKAEREDVERFLLSDEWRHRVSGVIVMTVRPEDALKREQGILPVAGSEGSIMNAAVLEQCRVVVEEACERLRDKFRILKIDTSAGGPLSTPTAACEAVVDTLLDWIEDQLQEDVLSLDKTVVVRVFDGQKYRESSEAVSLVEAFVNNGDFRPRASVEADPNRVQALPVVVVRNAKGDVLRLKRREEDAANPLHEKIVIWAGGHVRKEDAGLFSSVLGCAVRELQEELRISVEPDELNLLGAVYSDEGGRTSHHAALVYEWRARANDVAMALSNAEFFERRGASLSGTFVPVERLVQDIEDRKIVETWSQEVVRRFLAPDAGYSPRLL